MKVIYKYTILGYGERIFTIILPIGHNVVHVGLDLTGKPCIWAEVNPQSETETYYFSAYWTGEQIKDGGTYRGTFHYDGLIWHIYQYYKL